MQQNITNKFLLTKTCSVVVSYECFLGADAVKVRFDEASYLTATFDDLML